jgi:hypothetical protein
MATTS